jgi:hypothetical protein
MPVAVAPAPRSHYSITNAFRGRNRATSDAVLQLPKEPERAQLPKAASYTYFPQVKDLDQASPVADRRGASEDDADHARSEERTSESHSDGSSPSSEEAPELPDLQMPQLRPAVPSRRSSRFLSFSSRSRDPSAEPKPDRKSERGRAEAVKQGDSPSASPSRSLTNLRRKSWVIGQQHSRESTSPAKDKKLKKKESSANKTQPPAEPAKQKTQTATESIPEESEASDIVQEDIQPAPLSKKNKRLSGLFTATASASNLPSVPKSFSTEQLPHYPQHQTPVSPTHVVPPLPRNISVEKLRGIKTEPRKKDELWNAFRSLDADLRKYGFLPWNCAT